MMWPMPADPRDLASRLAVATPDDTVRGLVFNAAFDVAREAGDDAVAVACDPAGKGKRTDFRSYPAADLLEVLWRVVARVEGRCGGPDGAFRQIGYRTTAGVLGSMAGSTLLSFGSSPRLLVEQVPAAYQAVLSFGQRTVTWLGPTQARLVYENDFLPLPFHLGVLQASVDGTSAVGAMVEGRASGLLRVDLQIAWR
jgi:uncharacterized protein (TIGR02265 family)